MEAGERERDPRAEGAGQEPWLAGAPLRSVCSWRRAADYWRYSGWPAARGRCPSGEYTKPCSRIVDRRSGRGTLGREGRMPPTKASLTSRRVCGRAVVAHEGVNGNYRLGSADRENIWRGAQLAGWSGIHR